MGKIETDSVKKSRLESVSLDVAAQDVAIAPEYVTETELGTDRDAGLTMMEAWRQWPKCVFCIVGNEFCERFNYYGMRAVLTFYLLYLKFTDDDATAIYHGFSVVAYISPWLGAYLADGILGKFRVVLFVSLIYAAGSIILAGAAMKDEGSSVHPALDLVGLATIALGTGGIKPCVAPFGADQFEKGQEAMIGPYFSFFYASINAGSLFSIFLSPILASNPCLGQATCYPLAFGIPAGLMIIAVLLFWAGSRWYKKPPPTYNVFNEVAKAIKQALVNRRFFTVKREHWLDHYMDSHSCAYDNRCLSLQKNPKLKNACHKKQLIEDIKSLFRIIIMLLPVPLFWTLFDQQGSRWLIQTSEMNYKIGGPHGWTMPPALMQAINPILILTFIPLFQTVIYPAFRKIGINPTPLRRMVVGGFVAAGAFVIAGFLQMQIKATLPSRPEPHMIHLGFMNTLPCNLTITTPMMKDDKSTIFVQAEKGYLTEKKGRPNGFVEQLDASDASKLYVDVTFTDHALCAKRFAHAVRRTTRIPLTLRDNSTVQPLSVYTLTFGNFDGAAILHESTLLKSSSGLGDLVISIVDLRDTDLYRKGSMCSRHDNCTDETLLLCYNGRQEKADGYICHPNDVSNFATASLVTDPRHKYYRTSRQVNTILPDNDEWHVYFRNVTGSPSSSMAPSTLASSLHAMQDANFTIAGQGGIWLLGIYDNYDGSADRPWAEREQGTKLLYRLVSDNEVPIYWQVPQFAVITAAEILVSITGLEFSYSQAAPSMKSILQAVWLTTVSIGDFIIMVVAGAQIFPDLYKELFFFAGLMAAVSFILMLLARFYYTYRFYDQAGEPETTSGYDELETKTISDNLSVKANGF